MDPISIRSLPRRHPSTDGRYLQSGRQVFSTMHIGSISKLIFVHKYIKINCLHVFLLTVILVKSSYDAFFYYYVCVELYSYCISLVYLQIPQVLGSLSYRENKIVSQIHFYHWVCLTDLTSSLVIWEVQLYFF